MIRRRSTPWIHRWSRVIIAAIASCGALVTGYLTVVKYTGGSAACNASAAGGAPAGCNDVLNSAWATVLGQPLALFGFLAYGGMLVLAVAPLFFLPAEKNPQRREVENITWLGLLIGGFAMTVFSSYLMYVLATEIKSICPYCIASALFSLSMLLLTVLGRTWEDIGQILFTGLIVSMVTLIGTLGVYAGVNKADSPSSGGVTIVETGAGKASQVIFDATKADKPNPEYGWEITTTSGTAEIELARHLAKSGAKEYVAFWCPHCHEQKLLFGKEAYAELEQANVKVECAAESPKGKPQDCQAAGIQGFPTWIINGKQYSGVQNLDQLAKITGYKGARDFKYFKQV